MPRGGTTTPTEPTTSFLFEFASPVGDGTRLLHSLNTTTPTVLAKNTSGVVVHNVYVQPIENDPFYDAGDLSELKFVTGSTFTGTIELSTP